MSWATTLIQFPQGLVAIAISAAILPTLSRQAVAAQTALRPFMVTLGQGLRLALVLIIPAAVGLFVLAEPTVALLFERGKFGAADTQLTALALRLYLLGLPFAAVDLLLVYAFYARQNTLTPALVGVISLAAYMAVAIGLLPWYSFFALMIADSVKHVVHSGVSAWLLWRGLGNFGDQRLARTAALAAVAAAGMGLLTWAIAAGLDEALPRNALGHLLIVAGAGGAGLLAYSVLASRLGLDEWRWIRDLMRQRLRRAP
jgi:putative peptidoglycan lipid II flippase